MRFLKTTERDNRRLEISQEMTKTDVALAAVNEEEKELDEMDRFANEEIAVGS